MKSKKKWLIVLILFLSLFFSLPGEAKRVLLVGVYDNPPLVFQEEGKVRGMYPEVLEYIAQREGWDVEYIVLPFSVLLSHLRDGRLDLLLSVAYSEEREKYLDFNQQTFLVNWGEVYTSPSSLSVSSLSDLSSKKIAVVKDDIYGEELKKLLRNLHIEAQFWETEDYQGVFAAVKEGRADAGVVSRLYGGQFAKFAGLAATPIVFLPTELRFAVPQGKNRDIIDRIDEYLLALKVDPHSIYYQSLNYWLSVKEEEWRLPSWFRWFLTLLSLFLLLSLFWSYFLRREVKRRTKELVEKSDALTQEVEEREVLEEELRFNLDFQRLIANISLRFVIDSSWERSVGVFLEEIRRFARASEVVLVAKDKGYVQGEEGVKEILTGEEIVSWREKLAREGPLWANRENLPERYWRGEESGDINFVLSFPLEAESWCPGFLELVWREKDRVDKSWIEEHLDLFQTFPYLLSNALGKEEMRKELKRERDWLETVLRSITDGVIVADMEGSVTFMNQEAEALTGWSLSAARGKKLEEIFPVRDDREKSAKNLIEEILKKGKEGRVLWLKSPEKGEVVVTCSGAPIGGEEKQGTVIVLRNITERYWMEEELRISELRYRLLFNQMLDGFALLEEIYAEEGALWDFVFLEVNPAFEGIAGLGRENIVGFTLRQVFPLLDDTYRELLHQVAETEETTTVEMCVSAGEKYLEVVAFSPAPGQIAVICRDITEKKKKEEEIRYLSFHDVLTGLYNRAFFEEELRRLDTGRHLPLSLIFLDVDGLKEVNDALGHEEGDKLLQEIARVLQKSTREGDVITRWGGDEFVILLPQTTEDDARQIGKRIEKNCEEAQGECLLPLSASWGAATKENNDQDIREIFRRAEEESYQRKFLTRKDFFHSLISVLVRRFYREEKQRKRQIKVAELIQRIGEKWGWKEEDRKKLHFLNLLWIWKRMLLPERLKGDAYPFLREELIKIYPEFEEQLPLSYVEWNSLFSEIQSGDGRNGKGAKASLATQLLSLIETYELLIEEQQLTPQEAVRKIRREAGKRFDPELIEILEEIAQEE
ncbi:MAG: hypothetical protein PWP57_175 [Candidatus Atribacteria bacterium]|nr:hypothetical protein [Candidatus Atribacteria bacterium]